MFYNSFSQNGQSIGLLTVKLNKMQIVLFVDKRVLIRVSWTEFMNFNSYGDCVVVDDISLSKCESCKGKAFLMWVLRFSTLVNGAVTVGKKVMAMGWGHVS